MSEYADNVDLVPFEIGLQASETILMWVLGFVYWILGFFAMIVAVKGNLSIFGILTYVFGGILLLSSQFVTKYDPIKTTRIPINGIILWVWTLFLAFFILLKGWSDYMGSSTLLFVIFYLLIALLVTGGLLVANFTTSLKILNWMNMDMTSFLYASGAISLIAGITHIGFDNPALIDISNISGVQWLFLFLFGMLFVFTLELFSGAHRFNEIITYAKGMATGEFSLTPVINNYYIMGSILALIIGFVVLLILGGTFLQVILQYLLAPQLANSVMANSVYQIVFTMAWIFIPLWIVLILWMEYKARREKAEEEEMRSGNKKPEQLGLY